ncbi:CsgG/HfaB family protein, partial [Candidatus Cloacimonadota bacterium]
IISTGKLPAGALTYDPNQVTQVGSRLTIAVLPFEANENAKNLSGSVTDKMITQLVNLRRFRVIERGAIEDVMKEQAFALSGMVDEDSAIEVGKIVGADVIIIGRLNIEIGFGKVNARGVDIETGETIVAKEASAGNTNIEHIEKLVESVAIMIYNDLPLVEGSIVSMDEDLLYLDIGSDVGVRKGTKCVAFREGNTIKHPKTKKVLGKKVTKLGELIVIQVQEKLATARIVSKEGSIEVGDKVVVK